MAKVSLLFLLIGILLGCQKSPSVDDHGILPPQRITIAYTTQPQNTLVHVAVAKGYFKEEGLDVQSLMFTYGRASLQSLLDHNSDFAAVAETPFMFNVLKGEKIFLIANVEASSKNNAIVARKDAGITTTGDLKGKRIGFTPGTTSDFFLDSLLTANNLTRNDIKPIALKPEEMADAITENKVDAVCTWNYPLTQIKRLLADNGIIFQDPYIYTETYNFATGQEFANKNPETVKRFLRAMLKAERFVADHTSDAEAIMATATKTDIELVREVWNTFNYRVTLDQRLLLTLEDETRWAIKNHLTDKTVMPDYRKFIHADSLRAVAPGAVRTDW